MIYGRWRRLGLRDRKLNTQQLSGILSHEWKSMNEVNQLSQLLTTRRGRTELADATCARAPKLRR